MERSVVAKGGFRFDTRYTTLPSVFHHAGQPILAPAPRLIIANTSLAEELGLRLEELSSEEQAALFSGRAFAEGSAPLSQAYAGHQFGGFSILGDGRAHLLGEHVAPQERRVDIQLKGSGPTPYSRGGDGRATLGPMLREYLISEAMAALRVPTTRSLAVVSTGDAVLREGPLPGAILTRVATSHIRVGTFEFAAACNTPEPLQALLAYTIERHDPSLRDAECPALALWDAVARRQAALVSAWMRVGFIHGVMNTDNMTVSGETIDYGPCAFIDRYAKTRVFSSIDHQGRYSFGNQPWIARWNLARFAEALLPAIDAEPKRAIAKAQERLEEFEGLMNDAWTDVMREKLGLPGREAEDFTLATDLLTLMEQTASDYTDTFRALSGATSLPAELAQASAWAPWKKRWDARCQRSEGDAPSSESLERMGRANPALIPRNHLVEAALHAAVHEDDMGPFHRLLAALKTPYEERADLAPFQTLPPASFASYQTFCGT